MKTGVLAIGMVWTMLFTGIATDRITTQLSRTNDRMDRLAEHIREMPPGKVERRVELLGSTVRITSSETQGSGTIIRTEKLDSGGYGSWIITVNHVISSIPYYEEPKIQLYDPNNFVREVAVGSVIRSNIEKDLAIVYVETVKRPVAVANLPTRSSLGLIHLYSSLYSVGCPMGNDPVITEGHVTHFARMYGKNRFFQVTAASVFGNSGGGIFRQHDMMMIGVSDMIQVYKGMFQSHPIEHLGLAIPIDVVYDWMDKEELSFLYPKDKKEGALYEYEKNSVGGDFIYGIGDNDGVRAE